MSPLFEHLPLFLALLVLWFFFKILGGASFKGWLGEFMVGHLGLRRLDSRLYRSFRDLYFDRPDGKGTTQIDHVVVSPFGIFVIETKNYRGWIFGSEKQPQWTRQRYGSRHRFQNPLHQNSLHVSALRQFLGLPEDRFHSLVMFVGDAQVKTSMPSNVINRGLLTWIHKKQTVCLDPSQLESIHLRLAGHKKATNGPKAKRAHLAFLKSRRA